MLKELTIKNFMSFRNETVFSMEADVERVSEHKDHIVQIAGNKILKVASFYGPNGGGKSNFIKALSLLKYIQMGSASIITDFEFSCVYSDSSEIEETVFFIDDSFELGCKYIITPIYIDESIEDGDESPLRRRIFNHVEFQINYEEVIFRKKDNLEFETLFTRLSDGAIKSNFFDELIVNQNFRLAKNKSVVKYIYETFANNDGELSIGLDVIRRLMNQINSVRRLDLSMRGYSKEYLDFIIENEEKLVELLNNIDVKICSIKINKEKANPIYFVREIECDGVKKVKELSLMLESAGTRKIFDLFVNILRYIDKSTIFYCDDMNAYLHPKLYRAIVNMFQQNTTNAQLIYNSHDIINMDNDLFRRDEIWFVFRDENYVSKMIPLSNIVNYKGEQVRKDAKFYKQYLEGRFGADPFIKRGLKWNE